MTRAYIRLDPAFDERKYDYPDGPYAALVATFCLAEHQPERGRFRSVEYLKRLLGRRGRHVRYLIEHGDVIELRDGRAYVVGWDEWQEGDWKVAERVRRIRVRRGEEITPDVTVGVTPDVTADRLDSGGGDFSNSGGGAVADECADPADAYWQLTGRYPSGKLLKWIDDLLEQYGSEGVVRALAGEFATDSSVQTLMGRATDRLRREARELDRKEREEERVRLAEKRARPRVLEPWQEEFRRRIEEQYAA